MREVGAEMKGWAQSSSQKRNFRGPSGDHRPEILGWPLGIGHLKV